MEDPKPDVFALPETHPLRAAHKHSIYNRANIEASAVCGCFYCKSVFAPSEIVAWTDKEKPAPEQTALCPRCGIDSVIGDASGYAIDATFLADMHAAWF